MEKNKKKILIGSVSGIAAAVLLTGIIVAAVQGSGKAVKVAPVSNMNSGGWSSGSEISDYGTVTTNMNQDIYYDDSLTVKEVYVKAGDTVKIGDRLVAYDTTLATMEKEMKQMEIEGIALNRKNIEAELKQLRGTKAVAKGNVAGTNTVVKASAAGTDAVVNADTGKSRTTASVQRQNMTAREGNTDTGTAGSDQDSTVTDGKETGKPFPEELKGTKIYDKITEESVPYNEDGDGTEEKPYRYLCAPGVTVHAQFMLKVLENREICTFEVVDDKDNPTRILYEWTLDGKNGQIIKPVQPDQRRGVDAVSGVGTERGAFGAPADGAAHVAHRHHSVSARNREFINRFQNLLHGVDAPFEPCNGLRVQRSDLVAPRLPRGQQRLDRHQPRKNAVQVADRRRQRRVAAHVVGQQGRESGQFVDRAVSLDPFVGLEDPLAADQRGHSLVARFRVYLHILKCCFGKWLLKISR